MSKRRSVSRPRPKGTPRMCPECKRTFSCNRYGTLPPHNVKPGSQQRCVGSGYNGVAAEGTA